MQDLLNFTSALMCFPEHQRVLFILVTLHNSANTPTTKTTYTATHQSGCMGVQTQQATRRLNTTHNKHVSQPSNTYMQPFSVLWIDNYSTAFYFSMFLLPTWECTHISKQHCHRENIPNAQIIKHNLPDTLRRGRVAKGGSGKRCLMFCYKVLLKVVEEGLF